MEDSLLLVTAPLKEVALPAIAWCMPFAMGLFDFAIAIGKIILLFSIPYIYFHLETKKIETLALSEAQKSAFDALTFYLVIICFPVVIFFISSFIDCVILFANSFSIIALFIAIFIFIYTILIYKYLFTLISFKRNAITLTRIFLVTLPFIFVLISYFLAPYDQLLNKPLSPFGNEPDYTTVFIAICCFSVPYLLFFTFSKRIKAAWADPPPLPKEDRADPRA